MDKKERKKHNYRSMSEFEKKFFPKSFEQRIEDKITGPKSIGAVLANDSLKKIMQKS